MVRLERGGVEFLIAVSKELADRTGEAIYSPALFPGSTRVWRRAGFEDHSELAVMERTLGNIPADGLAHLVESWAEPDWEAVLAIDRAAFEGFWGMSRLGLEEAHQTNRDTVLLTVKSNGPPEGFAIVGSQWGIAYLHRIAVLPARSGQGVGSALLTAAMRWGAANGARSMVLNVRRDNKRAQALYRKTGFTKTGTSLQVLRHGER
jgi:ribosomal protein S18 acetylase RimI-like enzyme